MKTALRLSIACLIVTGLVAFLMAVESEYSIMDAVSNSGRLDRSLWQRIVVQSEEGVDVIGSPSMAGSMVAHPEQLGQVLATNPAHAVRGPAHVVKRGKTPVLTGKQTRELLDSIRIPLLLTFC